MWINSINESWLKAENSHINLPKELQQFVTTAEKRLKNNPNLANNIIENTNEMLNNTLQNNPEWLLAKIDATMQKQIDHYKKLIQDGEIHLKEGQEKIKNIIYRFTKLKLYVLEKINSL